MKIEVFTFKHCLNRAYSFVSKWNEYAEFRYTSVANMYMFNEGSGYWILSMKIEVFTFKHCLNRAYSFVSKWNEYAEFRYTSVANMYMFNEGSGYWTESRFNNVIAVELKVTCFGSNNWITTEPQCYNTNRRLWYKYYWSDALVHEGSWSQAGVITWVYWLLLCSLL